MLLTWYFAGGLRTGTKLGPAYRLDRNYELVRVWAHCPKTGDGDVTYDINADGVSILSSAAVLTSKGMEEEANVNASSEVLGEGTILTLDIDAAGARQDLTVQLDLEEV